MNKKIFDALIAAHIEFFNVPYQEAYDCLISKAADGGFNDVVNHVKNETVSSLIKTSKSDKTKEYWILFEQKLNA